MVLLEMRFLGGLSLQQESVPLIEIKSLKGQALLCYLAVSQKQVPRPLLAALFWPDMPDSQALMNLRKVLLRLKPLSPYLLITRQTVAFNLDAAYWLDVADFESATTVLPNISRLQKAIALYQGDFLDGVMLADAPLFEEWVLAQQARLREIALAMLQRLVAHFSKDGGYETAVAYARQLLTIEPWHEETHRELMRLLALSGQRSAALAQYEICHRLLADELGVSPTTVTVQLYDQIKAGEWNNGELALRPFRHSVPPTNLPPQMTPFVGRESELAQLQQLLTNVDNHLITIVGPGGMGKTCLALALATRQLRNQQSHPFHHGVYFAALARLESADLLATAVAEAINFHFVDDGDLQAQLLRYLASKSMLLVLDNFEHLLAGVDLVEKILHTAPNIKIIVTSRSRLNRRVEQLFPLDGMAFPQEAISSDQDNDLEISAYSAVVLFICCAQRVQPQFALTAANQIHVLDICRLLQGMPLGIVLAATWLGSLSPRAISREMRRDIDFLSTEMGDVPQRQRSLRAAFNHSWRLLTSHEQAVFPQLSLFRGGFTRQAALAVAGTGVSDLQGLVHKSFLTLSPNGRYDIHELLRQFAAEKLAESLDVETAVRDRHSAYYCTLLQQHTANWHTARQLEALANLTRESANVKRAWQWGLQQRAWNRLNLAIYSWGRYHQWQALFAEGESFAQAIVEKISVTDERAITPDSLRLWIRAQIWFGEFAAANHVALARLQQCLILLERPELVGQDTRWEKAFTLQAQASRFNELDRQKERHLLEECLRLNQEFDDSWGIAKCLISLGHLDWGTGHYALAQERLQNCLIILQRQGDQLAQASVLNSLAWINQHLGHLDKAERLRREIIEQEQLLGTRSWLSNRTANLAYTLWWQGKFAEAHKWAEKSLSLCREYGVRSAEGYARLAVGGSLLFAGEYERSRPELTLTLARIKEVDGHGIEATVHWVLGCLALVDVQYQEAQSEFAESFRLYEEVQDNFVGLAMSGLAFVACLKGEYPQAQHHFIDVLTYALKLKDYMHLIVSLPGIALYLAKTNQLVRAVEVWAQARCQPFIAHSQWHEDVVGQVMERAAAELFPEIVTVAQENGRKQDIWKMAETILAELQAEELAFFG